MSSRIARDRYIERDPVLKKILIIGAGGCSMVIALAVLAEDSSLIPSTYRVPHNSL